MSDQKLTIGNTPAAAALTGAERIWVWQHGQLRSALLSDLSTVVAAPIQTIVTSSPYNALATDLSILVNMTVSGVCTINLPSAASRNGQSIFVKDAKGIAYDYNLTIHANGSDRFEGGATNYVFYDDFDGREFIPALLGATWTWVVK